MKKYNDSKVSGLKGFISKALAVVMCVSMLMTLVATSTGCNFINNITDGLNVTGTLSEAELARLVVNAIISDKNVGDSYEKIPKTQLDGLSYSIFSEYCSILRKHSQLHGNVDSFKILDDVEKYKYFDSILSKYDTDIQSLDSYGDMDVIEICYSEDKAPNVSPVRFVIANKNGKYVMPSDYITDSMLAYSYITHYFDMIDEGNTDGLEAIIKTTYSSDIYMKSVIDAKADYIVDYYRLKVKSNSADYELKLFSPTHIVYKIPEVFAENGTTIVSKTVELYKQKDGTYRLEDKVPVILPEIRVFMNGESKLRLGSTYTPGEIYDLIGKPIVVAYTHDSVMLTYNGMTLTFEAEVTNGNQWSAGRLSAVSLRKDEAFTLNDDLFVGMNISELLLIYPMFDECDYTGSFTNGDGEFVLDFEFDDYGNAVRIRLGEVNG